MGPPRTPGRRKQRSRPAFYIIIGICIGISALKSRLGQAQPLLEEGKKGSQSNGDATVETLTTTNEEEDVGNDSNTEPPGEIHNLINPN